ncbi:hypothetical protein PT287_07760 [Lactobacillus sp. ESL0679]|uniref:hypothetical protein n=1 Tax=Lactobacillus sp. ESL0679 TaxID=2983209 RepID=UPI0023F84666|nr:hypothetical protein [Lactobacillus sp. ESL0679]MDF7683396.1 hypothetical protein [Lactobacillus sp. ESL0679]
MAGKTLDFNGKIKNFKAQDGTVTITVTADAQDMSLDQLSEIAQAGGLSFQLEASQQEMIDDNGEVPDGQGDLFDEPDDDDYVSIDKNSDDQDKTISFDEAKQGVDKEDN